MKGAKSGLHKARHLYRRRNYAQLINYLEPQVFMFRDNAEYYHLLGEGCFRTGDFSGAHSYLMRAHDIDPQNTNTLLTLGAVYLRRRQMEKALQSYLLILDSSPNHRRAKRALSFLRTLEEPDDAMELFESRRMQRLLPKRTWYIPRWIILPFFAVAVAAAGTLVISWLIDSISLRPERTGSEIASVTADQIETRTSGQFERILTEREIERLFRDIRRDFDGGHDNLVRRKLNRITQSNASLEIQDRANLLWDYLKEPTFTTLKDNFTYQEIQEDPRLYEHAYVRWRGLVANATVSDSAVRFDLLVGYETAQVLLGIVPVEIPFSVVLENGQPVELIGRLSVDGEGLSLTATNIRILPPDEVGK